MLLRRSVLNDVPALTSRVVGKYVHQNRSSSLRDVMVHLYVSMWLSRSVVPLYVSRCGSLVVLGISYSNSSLTNGDVTLLEKKSWFGVW